MSATLALTLTRGFRKNALLVDTFLVLGGSILIGLLAQLQFPLPFTPVPVTGQTLGVLLIAAALGSTRGTAAVVAYLAEGLIGFPVFAGGPATIGYLAGFVAAAWVTGRLAERGMDRTVKKALPAFVLGQLLIYLFGAIWLSFFVGGANSIRMGIVPFLPGDLLKILLAATALPTAWKFVSETRD